MAVRNDGGVLGGLCGWFGAMAASGPAERILAQMGATLGAEAGAPLLATPRAGLQVVPTGPGGGLATEGGVTAGIDGTPRWSHPDLAALAETRGHATALLAAYRVHGRALLDHLHGHFAAVVLDPERAFALLAVDRMGVHPLCVARHGAGGIVFGSTTTAVATHPGVSTTLSMQALYDYLFFYRVPAPLTIYEEQEKLLPAQVLTVADGIVDTGFYWRMPYGAAVAGDGEDLEAALFASLRTAMGTVARDEDPARVGAFLSGGLDSSAVLGLWSERADGPARAFTIGFDSAGYDETEYAAAAARHFGAEHHIYTVTPEDVAALAPRLAAAYDEPFGNSSAVPAYYCARLAREHGVEVMLAGDGGDEIFAGNAVYARMKVFDAYRHLPRGLRRGLIEPLVMGWPGGDRVAPLRKMRSYIAQANAPMPERMFLGALHLFEDARRIMSEDALATIDPGHPQDVLRDVYGRCAGDSLVQCMMSLDQQIVLADNDLRKVGRMCALAGLRVRYPLLDDDVVEMSARIPPERQIRGVKLRDFFRRAMRDFLPEKVLSKRKHGFGLPYGPWIAGSETLRELVHDNVAAFARRGYVRRAFVEAALDGPGSGETELASTLWDMMILELWLQHHVDHRGAAVRAEAG